MTALTPKQIEQELRATKKNPIQEQSRGQWDKTIADVVGRELLFTSIKPKPIRTPNDHDGYVCVCVFTDEPSTGQFRLLVDSAACTEAIDSRLADGWHPGRGTIYQHKAAATGRIYYAFRKPDAQKETRKGGRR